MADSSWRGHQHGFRPAAAFETPPEAPYALLPFRFSRLDGNRYLLTNFAGEHAVLPRAAVQALIRHRLERSSTAYRALLVRHFLVEEGSTVAIDLLAAKYRTKQAFLSQFTSLFMFVTTLRCDHACVYCQVSGGTAGRGDCDMTAETAGRAIEFMFHSPSPTIKVEFQGGESLLNFDVVRHIVLRTEERNQSEKRDVAFALTTNLTALTDEVLGFCAEHGLSISTSLDGPRALHNLTRPRPDGDSYAEAVDGIRRVRETLGSDRVSALMTTTRESLSRPREIIDEYVRQGLYSIFLRILNPYGRAASSRLADSYSVEEWLEFYRAALAYVIDLNCEGIGFREEFTALLLRKILTPYATGFVDLQSPAGLGISGIVLNHDGSVYPSDEARMLAEMGDRSFRMGNVLTDSYEDIMLSPALLDPLSESVAESVPGCAECAFLPYCGSDPVRHYRSQRDWVGFKPTSDFCRRNAGVLRHVIRLLEDDPRAARVLRRWV